MNDTRTIKVKADAALGFPAITVVTTTSLAATNSGDDEGENTQTTSADVKPDVDASVVP